MFILLVHFPQQSSGASGLSCFTATQTSCDGMAMVTAGTSVHLPGQFAVWTSTMRNQVILSTEEKAALTRRLPTRSKAH